VTIFRPGPLRLAPAQAPGGVIFRVYDDTGIMLVDRKLRSWMDCDAAKADAIKTLEAKPRKVCLVVYDGDTGERWGAEDWDRIKLRMP
jgi:hypothetical protein